MLKNNLAVLFVLISLRLPAQGPPLSYFYDPATDLSTAYCYVSAGDQVRQKVAFFPVINEKTNAPMGTESYRKDIDVKGDLIFIGDDITKIICDEVERTHTGNNIWMMYEGINDSLDYDEALPLSEKINLAINKGASAVVVVLPRLCMKTPTPYSGKMDGNLCPLLMKVSPCMPKQMPRTNK